jgi:type I restriction enzyme R subunit
MTPAPEALARRSIDDLLTRAGWVVADADQVDLTAARGVAIREFPLAGGGFADYLLHVDGRACGVIEAKKQGATLTGVEVQSARYQQGLPPALPAWRRPLPFAYESTGLETHFTNGREPRARTRSRFGRSPAAGPAGAAESGAMCHWQVPLQPTVERRLRALT